MNNIQETWETYAAAWKAETAEEKLTLLKQVMVKDAVYHDPLAKTTSWDELVAYMMSFHEQVPGGHFVTTFFQTHSNQSVAKWNMVAGDGTELGEGISYCTYNDEGKLKSETGFFDLPPE